MPTSPSASPPRSSADPAGPGGRGRVRRTLGPVTFVRLEVASFVHSVIYIALLVFAFGLGNPQPLTFWLGLGHGVLWIGMSLVCIAAAKAKLIPFWLAVTVAVLGGLGPFAGSLGFIWEQRNRSRTA